MTIPRDKDQQDAFLKKLGISDVRVREAFYHVPREHFLPDDVKNQAYEDTALPIGNNQTISQPSLVAIMTQALELTGKETVLEIGTGSGYQTALLSRLAKKVVTIERIQELARSAKKHLHELGYKNVIVFCADGTIGYKRYAPYDAILVTAAAPAIPPAFIDQLKQDGRLVIPIGITKDHQIVQQCTKRGNELEMKRIAAVRFVPLIGIHGWKKV